MDAWVTWVKANPAKSVAFGVVTFTIVPLVMIFAVVNAASHKPARD